MNAGLFHEKGEISLFQKAEANGSVTIELCGNQLSTGQLIYLTYHAEINEKGKFMNDSNCVFLTNMVFLKLIFM